MVLEYTAKTKTTLRNTGIGLLVGGVVAGSGTLIYGITTDPVRGSAVDIVAKTTIGIAAGIALTGTTLLILSSVAKVKK
jgi:hypothetical protein